jgi:hypothetical protein
MWEKRMSDETSLAQSEMDRNSRCTCVVKIVEFLVVTIGILIAVCTYIDSVDVRKRELSMAQADAIYGRIASDKELAEIGVAIDKVQNDGVPFKLAKNLADKYMLDEVQAERWWRYLMQIWMHMEADWKYKGSSAKDCPAARDFARFEDNLIFLCDSWSKFDPAFLDCAIAKPPRKPILLLDYCKSLEADASRSEEKTGEETADPAKDHSASSINNTGSGTDAEAVVTRVTQPEM